MNNVRLFLLCVCATVLFSFAPLSTTAAWASDVSVIERGNPLRVTLLNIARPVFERATGGKIEFVVKRLAEQTGWVFGHVVLQRPGGGKIDWRKTQFAEDLKQGMFDPAASFFLLRKAKQGWAVREFAVGPTDLIWDGWRMEYGLSMDLFRPN